MPIFEIKNKKAVQVGSNINHFKNEAELRDFFADNLEELLGMRFLAKEYTTTNGRIDTLAIDEANSPVIIEYKWGQDNAIVVQGLFYLDWLKNNKKHFDLLVFNKLGKDLKVNWENLRVVLVSQGFDNRTIVAVQQVENVELVKYTPYKNNILYFESVYSPQNTQTFIESRERDDEVIYDLYYHLQKHNSTNEIKDVFYKLQEKMKLLPGVEEVVDQKVGITYRTTKSFTRFEFGQTYIDILLRDAKYDDPEGFVRDITTHGWGYKGKAKIRVIKDVDVVFNLVRQSYESTL